MSEQNEAPRTGQFTWNELVTTDEAAAKDFYTGLFGWTTEAFGHGHGYTLFKQGSQLAGGMMKCPQEKQSSHWLGYVAVADVDAVAAQAVKLGGVIAVEPIDIPTVGRIAILVDPQGAPIGIFKPIMPAAKA
jgi:hypothetical protein